MRVSLLRSCSSAGRHRCPSTAIR